jgi:2-oxoglutarate dehydrogenase E2 component (dihydrolipoamide succinyltransferase)
MTVDVLVPKWGLTMEDAEFVEWLVSVGDSIQEGDEIAELETDKITGSVESPASGVIVELIAQSGQTVVPGEVIARIETA